MSNFSFNPGDIANTAKAAFFDMYNQYLEDKMPSKKILSSQADILMYTQNFGVDIQIGDSVFKIGEVNNFSPKYLTNVIKQFKPYGSDKIITLIENKGWDISFAGDKIDWNLSYLIYTQEKLLGGTSTSFLPTENDTFNGMASLGVAPLFAIRYKIKYEDGTVESYVFKDVIILNYDFELLENNVPIPERVTAFSPERIIDPSFESNASLSLGKINNRVSQIINLMQSINKQ